MIFLNEKLTMRLNFQLIILNGCTKQDSQKR